MDLARVGPGGSVFTNSASENVVRLSYTPQGLNKGRDLFISEGVFAQVFGRRKDVYTTSSSVHSVVERVMSANSSNT